MGAILLVCFCGVVYPHCSLTAPRANPLQSSNCLALFLQRDWLWILSLSTFRSGLILSLDACEPWFGGPPLYHDIVMPDRSTCSQPLICPSTQDNVMCGSVQSQCEFIWSWLWSCRIAFQLVWKLRSMGDFVTAGNGSALGSPRR
ncbi:hypothetical protein BDW69DRAFT_19530 [Aspergillus filifer]